MPTHTLTTDHLRARGACANQVAAFAARYPDGLPLTGDCPEDIPPDWIKWAPHLLSPQAWAAYDAACASARAACDAACASARAACDAACAPARAAYEAACAPAWAAYDAACASALWALLCRDGAAK